MMQEEEEIRIVSYNVHSCVGSDGKYSIDRISHLLEYEHPDFVCLQEIEVNNNTRQRTRIWSSEHCDDQPNCIGKSIGLNHMVFAPAITSSVIDTKRSFNPLPLKREIHDADGGGGFGICILSRYPILKERRIRYQPFKKKTRRNALACLVQIPNKNNNAIASSIRIWIVNTHLGCHTGGEQYQQSLELCKFIESLSTADGVILCGDFNSMPSFRSIKAVKETLFMVDTWKERNNGVDSGCTFPAPGLLPTGCCTLPPFMRLDYIFTKSLSSNTTTIRTNFIRVVSQGEDEIDVKSSDHLALSAIFCIQKRKEQELLIS